MSDDDRENDRRKQSLLSLSAAGTAAPGSRGAGSILSTPPQDDAAARHRMARSRREAAPSPLLSALAAMEGYRPEPAAEPKKSRWSFRDLLSPRVKSQPKPVEATRVMPIAAPEPEMQSAASEAGSSRDALGERDEAPYEPVAETVAAETSPDDTHWKPLIDPLRVIGGVGSSKTLIVGTTILGAVIGVMVALSTPKKYESLSELIIDPRPFKFSDRDLTETGLPSDATLALVENQVRVMTSGTVLNKVVTDLKLYDDDEFNGQRAGGGVGNFIASLRALLSGKKNDGAGDIRHALAVGHLAENLTVSREGKTFVVVLGATTEEPKKSALIVETVTSVYLETYGKLQAEAAGRATGEIDKKLETLHGELEDAERAAEQFRSEHDLVGVQGRLISDDELVKLNEQLSIAQARTIELNARAASARSVKIDSVIGGTLPEELASPVITELRSQYAAIKQEADRLSVRLGPRHPQSLSLQAQMQGGRGQIANELQRIVASAQTDLKRAVQQEQDLAARLAQLKVRAGKVGDDLVTLRQLEREAAAKRTVYEDFLIYAKGASERGNLNTANVSVISPAYVPLDPVGPSRSVIAAGFMMLGFFGGVGLGMARGIHASLREGRSARRRVRRTSYAAATAESAGNPGDPFIGTTENDEAAISDLEAADQDAQEVGMNPLQRLIQSIRWPSRSGSPSGNGQISALSAAQPEPFSAENETSGPHGPVNQEAPPMYPYPPQHAYPQQQQSVQPHAAYPHHPAAQPAPYAQPYQPAFAPPHYPPHFAQQPVYPYPQAMPIQPAFHGWQPQPVAVSPYGYQAPMANPYPPYAVPPQPAFYPQEMRQAPAAEARPAQPSREMSPIEEVRESLREFRDAIRDLAEDRRKRYS